jgi:hypothetical protein
MDVEKSPTYIRVMSGFVDISVEFIVAGSSVTRAATRMEVGARTYVVRSYGVRK